MVFTDTVLPDGNWEQLLEAARTAPEYVNTVVVSAEANIQLYIETVERGAWDFVAPPFTEIEIAHVLRCAVENTRKRRTALARLYENMEQAGQAPRAVWIGWGT